MKLTSFGHSLLREAVFHLYRSVRTQLAGSASKVFGLTYFLCHLQEIVYVLCQVEIFEHSFMLPLMAFVEFMVTFRKLSILRLS